MIGGVTKGCCSLVVFADLDLATQRGNLEESDEDDCSAMDPDSSTFGVKLMLVASNLR
jgi:hypothetical protein